MDYRPCTLIKCNLQLFQLDGIVTEGYQGIVHHPYGETSFVIEKLYKVKILKSFERTVAILKFKEIRSGPGDRMILRHHDHTIGYLNVLATK